MKTIVQHHEIMAVFIARVFLGFLFFFQGIDAVFNITPRGVLDTIRQPLIKKHVPKFIISFGAYFTSYTELIAGFCLIIGFVKYYALYLLGIDLLIVSIVFGIIKPMWDMQYVFPRLVLLLFFLVLPSEWDIISVDYVWSIIRFLRSGLH